MRKTENIGDTSSISLKNDTTIVTREEVLKGIRYYRHKGKSLQKFPRFQNDREIVLESVKQNGMSLEHACEELKNDREIVLAAIKKDHRSFKFVGEELKNDKEFVFKVVKLSGEHLEHVSEELKNDKVLILEAVKHYGFSIKYASEEMKNDKEVVLEAVKQNGIALFCEKRRIFPKASDDLKNDREVVLEAVKQYGTSLQFASEDSKNDKEIVLEAVKKDGDSLKHASDELRNDKEVVLEAVKRYGGSLQLASEELKNDKEIVLEAVKQSGDYLKYASEEMKNNMQFWFTTKSDEELRTQNRNNHTSHFKIKSTKLDMSYCLRYFCERKSFKDLVIDEYINRGAYGGAYKCHFDVPNVPLVIKIYNDPFIDEEKKKELLHRDSLLVNFVYTGKWYPCITQHDNVVTILKYGDKETLDLHKLPDYDDYWKDISRKRFIKNCGMILMRYYETTLNKYLRTRENSLEIIEVRLMIWGLLLGICHIHKHKIVHRDLHGDNIFVEPSDGRILIADFGCSLMLRNNQLGFIVGKYDEVMFSFTNDTCFKKEQDGDIVGFRKGGVTGGLAPEIGSFDPLKDEYLDYSKSDFYSIGILGKKILEHLKKGENDLGISVFLDKLTVEDPKNRLGFYEVLEVGRFIEVKESEDSDEENGEFEDSDEE